MRDRLSLWQYYITNKKGFENPVFIRMVMLFGLYNLNLKTQPKPGTLLKDGANLPAKTSAILRELQGLANYDDWTKPDKTDLPDLEGHTELLINTLEKYAQDIRKSPILRDRIKISEAKIKQLLSPGERADLRRKLRTQWIEQDRQQFLVNLRVEQMLTKKEYAVDSDEIPRIIERCKDIQNIIQLEKARIDADIALLSSDMTIEDIYQSDRDAISGLSDGDLINTVNNLLDQGPKSLEKIFRRLDTNYSRDVSDSSKAIRKELAANIRRLTSAIDILDSGEHDPSLGSDAHTARMQKAKNNYDEAYTKIKNIMATIPADIQNHMTLEIDKDTLFSNIPEGFQKLFGVIDFNEEKRYLKDYKQLLIAWLNPNNWNQANLNLCRIIERQSAIDAIISNYLKDARVVEKKKMGEVYSKQRGIVKPTEEEYIPMDFTTLTNLPDSILCILRICIHSLFFENINKKTYINIIEDMAKSYILNGEKNPIPYLGKKQPDIHIKNRYGQDAYNFVFATLMEIYEEENRHEDYEE
jgi:hypothetical protein